MLIIIVLIGVLLMTSNGFFYVLDSTNVPVAAAAFTVTLLEFLNPSRAERSRAEPTSSTTLPFMADQHGIQTRP